MEQEARIYKTAKKFQDLNVWKKGHAFVLKVYKLTNTSLPREEMFGLSSQLKRASSSITANIAEGFIRKSPKEKVRFYNISQGSLEETKNFLILVNDLEYFDTKELLNEAEDIGRMLISYIRKIEQNS